MLFRACSKTGWQPQEAMAPVEMPQNTGELHVVHGVV